MSGDPEQQYLSDGITEDIITELSRFRLLLVIARNSSFAYKGRAIDVRQVGRDLGVRYALEGSVRRVGDRIRINCFHFDPSIKSSLAFLRKTPWARTKVEELFVRWKTGR